jgi:peptide/nickel transport system permease protein
VIKFLLKRLVYLVVLVFVATTFTYFLAAATLNPKAYYDGRNPRPSEETIVASLEKVNANPDTPIFVRYGKWLGGVGGCVVPGQECDLGLTFPHQRPVVDEIERRAWVSLRLLLLGAILGSLIGVAAGAYGAVKQYRAPDHAMTVSSFVILSIPVVVLAVFLKAIGIGINGVIGSQFFLTVGEITPGLDTWSWAGISDRLRHLILPSLVLILGAYAFYGRYQRSSMLDVLGSDFLRTAQAKGLRRTKALIKHALRTALIPMGTFFAYQFALLFVGATFTETIFGWHGMGQFLVETIRSNDVNGTAAVALFVAILVLIAGFLSDVVTAALDPRIRRS